MQRLSVLDRVSERYTSCITSCEIECATFGWWFNKGNHDIGHSIKAAYMVGRPSISRQGPLPTKAMLVWLGTYICNWLAIWLAIFLCLVVGFLPRFHSVWSHPLCNCLVKKINQGTDVLTHNCLPPLLALSVPKHVCTRLIILTSCKNNHKIKIDVGSWQSAVGIHPFDCKYLFIISKNADCIDCLYGEKGCAKTSVL